MPSDEDIRERRRAEERLATGYGWPEKEHVHTAREYAIVSGAALLVIALLVMVVVLSRGVGPP